MKILSLTDYKNKGEKGIGSLQQLERGTHTLLHNVKAQEWSCYVSYVENEGKYGTIIYVPNLAPTTLFPTVS